MSFVLNLLLFSFVNIRSSMMTENKNIVKNNYNDSQPFVVGILSPSTTVYIDQFSPNNREISPPNDLNLRRRNTNSFQITSVTVQGSRKNDDLADDSADDLDESHTDDLSSDFLDSSRADNEGYHSEDSNPIGEDLSPCGPIIFAHLPSRDPNMNLSIGVTPTFTAIGPNVVAGGVTMMTSKSESPISAQVPIMNPLPENWQRRFKVVKIMSSEPFRRGRWLCMDFKDPPPNGPCVSKDCNGTSTPPAIQITDVDSELIGSGNFAQVYEIPINQTFSGNFVMGNHQEMYGIILPQSEHLQPVTLVQGMSLQTTAPVDKNLNNLVHSHSIRVEPAVSSIGSRLENNNNDVDSSAVHSQSPPSTLSANNNNYNNNNYNNNNLNAVVTAVPNHVSGSTTGRDSPVTMRTSNSMVNNVIGGQWENSAIQGTLEDLEVDNTESFSSLANELLRTSGQSRRNPPTCINNNDICGSPPLHTRTRPPVKPLDLPPPDVKTDNATPFVVAPPSASSLAETNSSQSAPEKIPPSEVGHEVDPTSGSAASTGGNTVAIDNKIEQAMDLVKSHLMFAVREEVEVLKEKITELLERISQLEHENDILRANASAETLKQLNNQKKNTAGGNTGKQQSMAPVPPST